MQYFIANFHTTVIVWRDVNKKAGKMIMPIQRNDYLSDHSLQQLKVEVNPQNSLLYNKYFPLK